MKSILVTGVLILLVLHLALGQTQNKKIEQGSKIKQDDMQTQSMYADTGTKSTGLILQAREGERMVRRWGLPMTIKIDPVNGGSKQLGNRRPSTRKINSGSQTLALR